MVAAPPEVQQWLDTLQSRLALQARVGGNEWAETYRYLGKQESPLAVGYWRSKPWQRELLDALADPSLDWMVVLKAAQMGVSDIMRCAVGRWCLHDPGDVLWVTSTSEAAEKAMQRLVWMFENTPELKPLLGASRSDTKRKELTLRNGTRIVVGWATSPQSIASEPFRYVILDEVALYDWRVKGEGSPVRLAEERVKTFGSAAKVVLLSKPKDSTDIIITQFRHTRDQRDWCVPCPDCGHVQPLAWERVRWTGGGSPADAPTDPDERVALADEFEQGHRTAWVECVACQGEIRDTQAAHEDPRSCWVTRKRQGHAIKTHGLRSRAYFIDELAHWAKSLNDVVRRFLKCTTPSDLHGFYTGSLARALKSERAALNAEVFRRRAVHAAAVVPEWATMVLASADTQADCWWYVVRAWGEHSRSRLLDFGAAADLDELYDLTLGAAFELAALGVHVPAERLMIDAGGGMQVQDGNRTQQVYEFARQHKGRAFAAKGDGDRDVRTVMPLTWGTAYAGSPGKKRDKRLELPLCRPNAAHWKDRTVGLIQQEEPVLWEECEGAEQDVYTRQMTAQKLELVQSVNGRQRWVWRKPGSGQADHLFDASVLQTVLYEVVGGARRTQTLAQAYQAAPRAEYPERTSSPGWLIGRG